MEKSQNQMGRVLTLLILFSSGCIAQTNAPGTTTPSTSEIANAVVSGAVSNVLSGGAYSSSPSQTSQGTCPTLSTAVENQNCAVDSGGKILTLTYRACKFNGSSAVWNGSEIISASSAVSCGTFPPESTGSTLLRTFGSNPTTVRSNGLAITLDTTHSSGYSFSVSGGTQVLFNGGGYRKVLIAGLHLTATQGDSSLWDYSISTSPVSPLDVQLSAGPKILNGTVIVQNNLYNSNATLGFYTGTSVLKNVTYSLNSECCYPQSGSITTTFSGSKTGTETLTFSGSSCGAATLKDSDGIIHAVTMTHCF